MQLIGVSLLVLSNETTKNFIFPTIIHLFDNVLEQEYIDSMKEDIIKVLIIRKTNCQSNHNPKIHKHPKYKPC